MKREVVSNKDKLFYRLQRIEEGGLSPFWLLGKGKTFLGVLYRDRALSNETHPRGAPFWMNESQSSRKDGVRCMVTAGWLTL
jgi:hypothetical protein